MELLIQLVVVIVPTLLAFIFYSKAKKRKVIAEQTQNENQNLIEQYSNIIDVDKEIENRKNNIDKEIDSRRKNIEHQENTSENKLKEQANRLDELKQKYTNANKTYTELNKLIALYQDEVEAINFGIYTPQFSFDTSETFKAEITSVKNEQKESIKNGKAIQGGDGWLVNDSAAQGRKMINKTKKLMLRAFNGECDSLISKVNWNNVDKSKERIVKAFDAINVFGEAQNVDITRDMLRLKIKELRLTYEYQVKKQEEKEEQRALREQMREEEKARREAEKARKEAEKEEKLYLKALAEAQAKIGDATGEELDLLKAQLSELENKLQDAENAKTRAMSMAQQTKAGHVYVISNIGSFGENIYKIGMTRRLEPLDRVKELGDASVPFTFDVHALIYSDNAPELENKLHKEFDRQKVNLVNNRREFFNVNLSEIEKIVHDNNDEIEFTKIAEAKEYRESQRIRATFNNETIEEVETIPTAEMLFN